MAKANTIGKRCFISLSRGTDDGPIGHAIRQAVRQADFQPLGTDQDEFKGKAFGRFLNESIATAECVIADVTIPSETLYFELGLASALGKTVFLIGQNRDIEAFVGNPVIHYTDTSSGLRELTRALSSELRRYRRFPKQPRFFLGSRSRSLFAVDWDRLGKEEFENLCLELLSQLGYKRLKWQTSLSDVDIVAELPKKDPDGFEYRELWLISIGKPDTLERYYDLAAHEPEFLLRRLFRRGTRDELFDGREQPESIILLSISIDLFGGQAELAFEEQRFRKRLPVSQVRFRTWDRNYLTNLIYQFPPIGFKYFSDEGRSQSKFRKTPEQLYEENLELARSLTIERDLRVRAERDSVWKDISFAAAHKMGNPTFAIETNLEPLELRIADGRADQARQIVGEIRGSIEKLKAIIAQFKSLTNAQKLTPIALKLLPLLEATSKLAEAEGVSCTVSCDPDITVFADPSRISECLDELTYNALKWFDKPERIITITVELPSPESLPPTLTMFEEYALIRFKDNGIGISDVDKEKVFDAFFTTSVHGTGLGLALVRRIIEGLNGLIIENGVSGDGAQFDIYLPLAVTSSNNQDSLKGIENAASTAS